MGIADTDYLNIRTNYLTCDYDMFVLLCRDQTGLHPSKTCEALSSCLARRSERMKGSSGNTLSKPASPTGIRPGPARWVWIRKLSWTPSYAFTESKDFESLMHRSCHRL